MPRSSSCSIAISCAATRRCSGLDVDRAGVTVAAVRGQTQELLSAPPQPAKLRIFESMPPQAEVERLLLAARSTRLRSTGSGRSGGSGIGTQMRVPRRSAVDRSFVVRKGDRAKMPLIAEFVDEAKRSGMIRSSIDRAGLLGVDVAK